MKTVKFAYVLLVLFLFPSFTSAQDDSGVISMSLAALREYFPADIGMGWEYEIQLGSVKPLRFEQPLWETGEKSKVQLRREFIQPAIEAKKYRLYLEIDVPAKIQDWDGYALKVVKDELGVFTQIEGLYWAFPEGMFQVIEVKIYPESWTPKEVSDAMGYSLKPVIFDCSKKKNMGILVDEKAREKLVFIGIEKELLHFVRVVKVGDVGDPGDPEAKIAFKEHMWFQKGFGLMRLEQKIGTQTSMIWNLLRRRQTKQN